MQVRACVLHFCKCFLLKNLRRGGLGGGMEFQFRTQGQLTGAKNHSLSTWKRCVFWKTNAQRVSAHGKSARPRATCERRARSLGSYQTPLFGGFWGLAYRGFQRHAGALAPSWWQKTRKVSRDDGGPGWKGELEEPLRGCLNSKPWKPNPNPLKTRRGP
jgi:hypothetical protein